MKGLPSNWQERLSNANALGRLHGGLECCGTRGGEHLPYCPSGVPSNTMSIYEFLGYPEPVEKKAEVPLVIYKEDGTRVVIGTAEINGDGTAEMHIKDKGFLQEHFNTVTDGFSFGIKLQEFSIAASIDSPPVVKWVIQDDKPPRSPDKR